MTSKMVNCTVTPICTSHINDVVTIHCKSFPNSRSTQLGKPFLRKMYRWFVLYQPKSAFIAEVDGQPVGFVTGAIGGSSRKIFRYAFLEILWAFLRRPGLFLQPDMFEQWHSYLWGIVPPKRKPRLVSGNPEFVKATLDSIAVSPHARGKNVGKSLVSAFENAARLQGATILRLGVERDNMAARRLYESCGWELAREDAIHNSANYIKEIRRV